MDGIKNGRVSGTVALEPIVSNATEVQAPPKEETNERGQEQPTPSPNGPQKRSKKPLVAALAGAGVLAAGVAGFHWWQFASTHEETDNATVAGHVHQISSRIAGTVAAIPVKDNEEVKPGELLVQIDPHEYQVKVQQAQAALSVAQQQAKTAQTTIALANRTTEAQTTEAQGSIGSAIAAIGTAQAAVKEAQAGVPAAQAQLAQAEADLQKTQADYDRYNTLRQQGAVSQQQFDVAKAAYDTAVAQRDAAAQGVRQAQAKLAQAQEGVTQAQANLESSKGGLQKAQASGVQTEVNRQQYQTANAAITQAQANLAEAELQLSYTNITSPAQGRIGRRTVEVGNRVQSGQPLMAVVSDEMWVIANFKETQVEHMQPGDPVEIKLDAFPSKTFMGRVDSFSPASGSQFALLPPDNATGNFTKVVQRIPVKIVFDPQSIHGYETRIEPGMSAVITVDLAKSDTP